MQKAAKPGQVFGMLLQQHREQLLRGDQAAKPAPGVDHPKAGLVTLHRLPRRPLLIGVGRHYRRCGIHDVANCCTVRRSKHPLDGGDTDQSITLEYRHRGGAVEALAPHPVERRGHRVGRGGCRHPGAGVP